MQCVSFVYSLQRPHDCTQYRQQQLEARHSTERKTGAGHSIAFNKTTRRPCGTVSLRDKTTATRLRTRRDLRRYALCDPVTLTFALLP